MNTASNMYETVRTERSLKRAIMRITKNQYAVVSTYHDGSQFVSYHKGGYSYRNPNGRMGARHV